MRVLLALALILTIAGSARGAGEITLTVDPAPAPFVFASEAFVNVSVSVDCAVFSGVPPAVTATFEVQEPPATWIIVGLYNESATRPVTDCVGSRASFPWVLHLMFDPAAASDRSIREGNVTLFRVTASAENARGERFEASADLPATRGAEGRITGPMSADARGAPGETRPFALPFESRANADADVTLRFDAAPGLDVVEPIAPVRVPAEGTADVVFSLKIPGIPPNEYRSFIGRWTATSAIHGTPLGNGTIVVDLHHPGPSVGDPSSVTGAIDGPSSAQPPPRSDPVPSDDERDTIPGVGAGALLVGLAVAARRLARR